jgi:excisionase family DNA binding protein
MQQKLVSLREAAAMLGCSYWQALRLAHQGDLPAIKLGRRFLVPVPALLDWLHGRLVRPPQVGARSAGGSDE